MASAKEKLISSDIEDLSLDSKTFLGLAREILNQGSCIRFRACGYSMSPFIRDGDIIQVKPAEASSITPGDIVLYSNPDGFAVVHRVVVKKTEGERTVLLTKSELPSGQSYECVRPEELLGKVVKVESKGRRRRLDKGWLKILGLCSVKWPGLLWKVYQILSRVVGFLKTSVARFFRCRLFLILKNIPSLFNPALWVPKPRDSVNSVAQKYNIQETIDFVSREVADGLQDDEKMIAERFMRPGARILDIGCGPGREAIGLAKMGYEVVAFDIAPNMVERAREFARKEGLDIKFEVKDATALDYPPHSFDYAIFSRQGYSHIPSKRLRVKMLKSIRRILKEDGIFAFSCHYSPKKFFSRLTVMDSARRLLRLLGLARWISEPGDTMMRMIGSTEIKKPCFWHYFSNRKEVLGEIKMAGFKNISPSDTFFWVVKPDYKDDEKEA